MTEALNSRRRINKNKLKEPDKVGRLFALIGWVSGAAVASSVVIYTSQSAPDSASSLQTASAPQFKSTPLADPIETGSIPSSIGKKTTNTILLAELKQINQTNALLKAHSMSLARRLTYLEKKLATQHSENQDLIETGTIARTAIAPRQIDYSNKARVIVSQRPFAPYLNTEQSYSAKQNISHSPVIQENLNQTNDNQIVNKILHQNIIQKNEIIKANIKRATQTKFGIDLGSGQTLSDISEKWSKLFSKAPQLLANLKPLAAIHEQNRATILHLVAGPFSNAADTTLLCAKLRPDVSNCSTVTYVGQKIPIKH